MFHSDPKLFKYLDFTQRMQYAHNATLSVFVTQGESEEAITACLKKLSGLPEESFTTTEKKERVTITRTVASGFNNQAVIILELFLSQQKHVKLFLSHLLAVLSASDKQLLRAQKKSRIDSGLFFYLRFDKNHLLKDDILLTDGGSCFHVKLCLAAFPRKQEAAEKVVDALLTSS